MFSIKKLCVLYPFYCAYVVKIVYAVRRRPSDCLYVVKNSLAAPAAKTLLRKHIFSIFTTYAAIIQPN